MTWYLGRDNFTFTFTFTSGINKCNTFFEAVKPLYIVMLNYHHRHRLQLARVTI